MPISAQARNRDSASPRILQTYRAMLERELRRALEEGEPGLRAMLHYHMGWTDQTGAPSRGSTGKELRPLLCLFACRAVGGRAAQALPAAAALELVHNFSLIHDDVQDEDQERHHRPTVWALWGKPMAVVAGNAMLALADRTILELSERGVPAWKAALALRVLTECYLEIIEGQYLDVSFEQRLDVRPDEYLQMVGKKTGALIQGAMHLGALLGPSDSAQVAALRGCGRLLGLAFQAQDDVLGIWGDPSVTGKAVGADIQRRKKSLPVVYGFAQAPKVARTRLIELYRLPGLDQGAAAEVLGFLEELGAREFAQRVAEEKRDQALTLARQACLPPWADRQLEELADFIVQRQR